MMCKCKYASTFFSSISSKKIFTLSPPHITTVFYSSSPLLSHNWSTNISLVWSSTGSHHQVSSFKRLPCSSSARLGFLKSIIQTNYSQDTPKISTTDIFSNNTSNRIKSNLVSLHARTLTTAPQFLSANLPTLSPKENRSRILQFSTLSSDEQLKSPLKSIEEIPGPKCVPWIGTSWMYSMIGPYSRHTFHIADEDLYRKYGPIYKERRGGTTLVSLHRPKDIEKVFRNESPRPYRIINEALVWKRRQNPHVYPTVGLAESLDDEWYELRQKVSPALLKPKETQYLMTQVNVVAEQLRDALCRHAGGDIVVIDDLTGWMVRYGAEVIWRTALGTELGALQQHPPADALSLSTLALRQFQLMADIRLGSNFWKLWPKIFPKYRKFAEVDDAVFQLGSKHIGDARTRLKLSASSRPEPASTVLEKFSHIKDLDVRDANTVILDSFSAGVTTTASSLVLLLHRLGQEPLVTQRLQEELDNVFSSPDADVTQEVIDSAPYLRAVVMEGHRITPIIPSVIRILPRDIEISGYNIPAHTPLIAKTRAGCRDERHFDRALDFIPERWLSERVTGETEYAPLARQAKQNHFLVKPFGFGARMCVGKRLAEYEIYAALAKILANFDITSTGDVTLGNFLFLAPLSPVSLTLAPRTTSNKDIKNN
ncbi:Cytochrome P450 [Trinorchestia longiramus]|nr:Cytochrome P450 [Trinorchestia longiramus]